ncbi:MAG: hypothetical protein RBS39_02170 [Phycisphaerales bacterium]|nr:hypothetical protein [Phycisphaerales bacterium]
MERVSHARRSGGMAMVRWDRWACVVLAAGASIARGEVIVSRPARADPALVGQGYFSHSEPRQTRNFKHADQFSISTSARVESVAWWGISEGVASDDLANFDEFTIELFESVTADTGNPRPGTRIAQERFSMAQTAPTPTGRRAPAPDNAIEYRHHATLATPVQLDADKTYFIAISARSILPRGDGWKWRDTELVDGYSVSYSYASGQWLELIDTDSAFELHGVVPAPASAVPLIGLGCAASARRRPSAP